MYVYKTAHRHRHTHIYSHVNIHTHVQTYAHSHVHTHTHMCVWAYVRIFLYWGEMQDDLLERTYIHTTETYKYHELDGSCNHLERMIWPLLWVLYYCTGFARLV